MDKIIESTNLYLKANFALIKSVDKTYIYNNSGYITVKGKSSYKICKWLYDNIKLSMTTNQIVKNSPLHLKAIIINLLKQLFQNKLIYLFPKELDEINSSIQYVKLLEHLFCYNNKALKQYNNLIKSQKIYIAKGREFELISNEIKQWCLPYFNEVNISEVSSSNFLNHKNKKYLNRLTKLSSKFCLILSNQQCKNIFIEIRNYIIGLSGHVSIGIIENIIRIISSSDDFQPENEKINSPSKIFTYFYVSELFYSLCNIKNNYLWVLNKSNFSIKSHKLPLYTQSYKVIENINGTINNSLIRKDIPIIANDNTLINELENINNEIKKLVDQIMGPIIKLSEKNDAQIPLFIYETQFLEKATNSYRKKRFKCYGLSARECRNQVVLAGTENYLKSIYSSLENDNTKFAAGWSIYEAIFRAARNLICSNVTNSRKILKKTYKLTSISLYNNPTIRFLIISIKNYTKIDGWTISFFRHDPCIYSCHLQTDRQINIIEIGITIRQALINSLIRVLSNFQKNNNAIDCNIITALSWTDITFNRAKIFLKSISNRYRVLYINFNSMLTLRKINKLVMISLHEKN